MAYRKIVIFPKIAAENGRKRQKIETSYQILALIDVHPHTNFGLNPTICITGIYENVPLLRINGRTDGPTKLSIRCASQSLDAS